MLSFGTRKRIYFLTSDSCTYRYETSDGSYGTYDGPWSRSNGAWPNGPNAHATYDGRPTQDANITVTLRVLKLKMTSSCKGKQTMWFDYAIFYYYLWQFQTSKCVLDTTTARKSYTGSHGIPIPCGFCESMWIHAATFVENSPLDF